MSWSFVRETFDGINCIRVLMTSIGGLGFGGCTSAGRGGKFVDVFGRGELLVECCLSSSVEGSGWLSVSASSEFLFC